MLVKKYIYVVEILNDLMKKGQEKINKSYI